MQEIKLNVGLLELDKNEIIHNTLNPQKKC
ncbi:MAG: hypothetical protein B655_2153 [Methanobacterium sp. Maddingley MBC34]|nr:MAG: hypothetical protein B655_2153 [Methanobacterium sp. Maddingley MBC34]